MYGSMLANSSIAQKTLWFRYIIYQDLIVSIFEAELSQLWSAAKHGIILVLYSKHSMTQYSILLEYSIAQQDNTIQ